MQQFSTPGVKPEKRRRAGFVLLLLVLFGLSVAWQWTPLECWSAPERVVGLLKTCSTATTAPILTIAAYVIGGLVMFPIVVLIPATALLFGPVLGPVYAMAGCLLSAVICYILGQIIGFDTVRRLTGSRFTYISRQLARQGFLTIAIFRLLPAAPYTIVNLIAGAFRVRFRDYTLGTMVGLLPGIIIMTFVTGTAKKALLNPDMRNLSILAGTSLLIFFTMAWLKRRVRESAADE
jgi:uncharacterized membrane protein YdjX (TVP38/TMEM64 family)